MGLRGPRFAETIHLCMVLCPHPQHVSAPLVIWHPSGHCHRLSPCSVPGVPRSPTFSREHHIPTVRNWPPTPCAWGSHQSWPCPLRLTHPHAAGEDVKPNEQKPRPHLLGQTAKDLLALPAPRKACTIPSGYRRPFPFCQIYPRFCRLQSPGG